MSRAVAQQKAGFVGSNESAVLIRPRQDWFHLDLQSIWTYRELLYFLVWRDLKVRYRQTAIGAGWVILQPLLTTFLFTVIFGGFAKVSSDGLPYPAFSLAALIPWTLFSNALSRAGESIVGSANLVSKVYFPRLVLPLSGALSPLADFAISFLMLIALMIWYRIAPTTGVFALPFFLVLSICTALAVGVWLAALNVKYRDVRHAIPFLVQCWMFASPVVYPVSIIPVKWRLLYGLNPMVGVIEGFRWALLGKESPDFRVILVSTIVVAVSLFGGIVYFRRVELRFADEI